MEMRIVRAGGLSLFALALAVALIAASPAAASFPGSNGKIAAKQWTEDGFAIKAVRPDGGPISSLGMGEGASYSPDGSQLVFRGLGGLYVAASDGSGPRLLFAERHERPVLEVTYSTTMIVENEILKEIPIKVMEGVEEDEGIRSAAFLPDGATLAALWVNSTRPWTSYCGVAAPDDPECIEEGEPGYYRDIEYGAGGEAAKVIKLAASNGAVLGDLTALLPGSVENVAAAVDGRLALTYESPSDDGYYIYQVPSGGGAPAKVPGVPVYSYAPDYSPDGMTIVYEHDARVEFIPAAGGVPRPLDLPLPANADYQSAGEPVFSPDGKKIAFYYYLAKEGTGIENSIRVADLDGSDLAQVLAPAIEPTWQPIPPLSAGPYGPAAAPVKRSKAKAKKQVKLNRKGAAAIGSIVCGSSACKLKVLKAKLKIGKKSWSVKVTTAKKLGAGKSARVKLKVAGKALLALLDAGKGTLSAKVQASDARGKRRLGFNPTVKP